MLKVVMVIAALWPDGTRTQERFDVPSSKECDAVIDHAAQLMVKQEGALAARVWCEKEQEV